jgi:hypothetical protein
MKKTLFLAASAMFYTNVFSQAIVGVNKTEKKLDNIDLLISNKWITQNLVGENRNATKYKLHPYNQKESFGNALIFQDSIHFTSYYFAFCGLDCFTRVHGQYKRINKTTIELFVNSIEQTGTCAKPTMYMYDEKYKNRGKFKISSESTGEIILTRK